MRTSLLSLLLTVVALFTSYVAAQDSVTLLDGACSGGPEAPLTEAATGRTFVLDYPCDLRADEELTVILNLHGAGSNERYQRAYFPAWELKEKYRLVIATPHSPVRRWSEDDDVYLQNIRDALPFCHTCGLCVTA